MQHLNPKRVTAAFTASSLTASLVAMMPAIPAFAANSVCINEVCTKNTTVAAPDGKFYDYVELYNTSNAPISLAGYGLSDDPEIPMAYTLPADAQIPANGFLVVYCGVKADATVAGTSFGLSKNGDMILLSDPTGKVLDQLEIPALNDDASYGRVPDGSDVLASMNALSPGQKNPTNAVDRISVNIPNFSQESGFYDKEFNLTLSADAGCTIYYTLDGSDPTTASTKYSAAINVYDKSSEANVYAAETDIGENYSAPKNPVDKAMIVRAMAVDKDGNKSNIVTKTYFIGYEGDAVAKNMRVISLVTDPENLFNHETGIYVWGKVHDDWKSSPDYSMMTPAYSQPANFTQGGRAWERPANMTVFENGKAVYDTGVGIRIHGGATRVASQKSFNLYARSDYGDAKLHYDFFDGALVGVDGKVIDSFDKLTLRNGGNDNTTKLRDRLNQQLVADRSYGTQAQTGCVVFLDGEFWGYYNITEKIDETYIADHYDVKAGSVCIIKTDEQEAGSDEGLAAYEDLKAFVAGADFKKDADYNKFAELVDVQNFADYMATEFILGNTDFGDNNYMLWRTETVKETKEYADGKWRFVLFDTEYGQGLYGQSNANANIYNSLKQKNTWFTKMFYGLLENDNFRQLFVTNYFDLCNENYNSTNAVAMLNALEEANIKALGASYGRFNSGSGNGWGGGFPGWGGIGGGGFPWGPGAGEDTDPTDPQQPDTTDYSQNVKSEISTIRNFWQSRAENAKNLLLNSLGNNPGQSTCKVTLTNEASKGSVQLNTLTLDCKNGSWSGTYPSKYEISLKALPKEGANFTGWEVTGAEFVSGNAASDEIALMPTGDTVTIKAVYDGKVPVVTETYSKADVQKLLNHLLTKKALSAADAEKYDLDGNHKLDAKDLTLLKRKVK